MNRVKLGFISLAILLAGCDNTIFLPKSMKESVESPSPVAAETHRFPNAYECFESREQSPDLPLMEHLNYLLDYIKYCYQFAENEIQKDYLVDQAKTVVILAEKLKRYNSLVPNSNRTLESVGLEGNLRRID